MKETEERHGLPILSFENQESFQQWLAREPPSSRGLWLRLTKKGSLFASLTKGEAIDAALCHGWIDGQLDKYDEDSWLVRFTPRKAKSQWSQANRTRAQELIESGRMTAAGMAEVKAAEDDGRWLAAYASASKAVVPPDFQAALDRSSAAAAFFATLRGANRYAILYRIETAKKLETRSRRIEQFIAMLERGETIH